MTIRVVLPQHLRTLASVGSELQLEIEGQATQRSVLDALEARYPMLCGTIRDHVTKQRRPFLIEAAAFAIDEAGNGLHLRPTKGDSTR